MTARAGPTKAQMAPLSSDSQQLWREAEHYFTIVHLPRLWAQYLFYRVNPGHTHNDTVNPQQALLYSVYHGLPSLILGKSVPGLQTGSGKGRLLQALG